MTLVVTLWWVLVVLAGGFLIVMALPIAITFGLLQGLGALVVGLFLLAVPSSRIRS